MGIDFSKFSQDIQAKIKAALEDAKSPNKIDAAELRAMNLEKDVARTLMQELCGDREYLGDGYIKMQNKNKILIMLDKPENDSFVPLTKDSLEYYHNYYDESITQGIYRDGVIYLADSKGRPVKDKFNNYITEKVSVQEYSTEEDVISGNFELIENEPSERTNRRFAIALARSMYNEVIQELQTLVKQMGVLDVGFWREALGMGVQAIADLKENQELITASTKKKIERIEKERDNICDTLSDLIDSPDEFEAKFYQLVGKDYRDNAFEELREIQHDQDGKGSKTKYKECVAKFEELYPDNNISKNVENWEDSAEYQKTVDEIADIVVMLYMTAGIGKLLQGSVSVISKNILLAAAKGDRKAVIANFAKLAPEVQTVWQSLAKKEFGVAAAQTVTPMAQSAATMSSWEGVKAFLNNLTNAEEISPEELLNRTLDGIISGAEMGVVMGGLEVAAIGPAMTKLAPALGKLSGASGEISALMEKSGGTVPMEKVLETYTKASETLRGKIVKEGTHGIIALPVLTAGFTATDTAIHYDETEFRKTLLDAATTDEEREAIMKMSSIDLRIEFAKTDFINQVKGMVTIEGVGLMFRRLQAGRLAAHSMKQNHRDIVGAKLREVKENGKTAYEICDVDGKAIPVKNENKTITRFSSIEEATAVYSVMCAGVYAQISEITERPSDKELTQYTQIGNIIFEVKQEDVTENPAKIAKIKHDIAILAETEPEKAKELGIVLEMFINPISVTEVKDEHVDAVVNYLNDHYAEREKYLSEQADGIGITDKKLGKYGHRIKGEWSTRDKVANFVKEAVEKKEPKTLLDAYNDVRDKYASRTVFEISDFSKHPEVIAILEEGNYSDEAYDKAILRAAELQSEPVLEKLVEAMRRAKEEGKDFSMMRISNYSSEGGIPIFSPEQMERLKLEGAELGVNVEFIKLAKDIDPKAKTEFVDGASTKQQPSGYTALQINFVTKSGEVIEWQYRGKLVDIFAEAEHLPYDLRTGKHPWRQFPVLEKLYKPIADILDETVMPKPAYKQLNRYFTDYYKHLRKLELGFESNEPRLQDYESWEVTDEKGVKKEYKYKFDKRLEAENLIKLHEYAEAIKDGLITPERAVEEFNAEVRKQSEVNTSLSNSRESRIKDLSQKLKNIVGKDFALELMEIKDNDLFAFLEKELVEWDDPDSIRRILSLAKNAALFSEGGFESMDKFSQKAYETSCFWGNSIKDRIKKAEKIEDSAQRDIALAHIKMHVYSKMLMTSEVRDNMEFRNLITEKFIKPGIPETYYNAIKELEKLTGKKVYVIQDFRPTTENEYDISFANMDAWLNMSEKVKNFYRQHSDELINKYKMISKYLADEYEELSESELDAYAKKGGIEYQYSSSDTPRKILEMEESKINRIKELRQRWKNSEGEPVSSSLLEKCLEECSQEELEIIDKRQLYKIRTDVSLYLEPKYLKVLAKLNDNNWNALKKMGLFDAKNNLQLSYLKIDSDPFGNITRHDIALENLINSIRDLKNSIPVAKKFMASGYDKTESLIQAGYLVKGLNETEAAELQEFNWDNAKSKYDNISRMMKAKPDKYVSGQFLSLKSIYELFTKEVLNQNYEYKSDLQNAVRSFFYENDIARCEFYSRLQQEISDKIRSNTIDISEAKEILKVFMGAKVQLEEKTKDALKPEDIINDSVNEFLYKNEKRLTRLCAFMDKEAMETLLRKRFSDVEEYLETLDTFNFADLKLLSDLSGSYNLSGKPFLPTQKMEFIDLISGYRVFGLDMSEMKQMVKEQKVDIAKLHKDLFVQIMKKIGMSDAEVASIPNEKLMTWDLKYMHLLAKEVAGDFVNLDDAMHRSTKPGDNAFADIIRNGNLKDFKQFIQDTTNIYGQTNLNTKTEYTDNNMNYNLWINPPENMNVRFKNIDKDTKVIVDLSASLLNDINILRRNDALRGIIDKQFKSCVKDNEFIIPSDCQVSAVKLKSFIEKLLKTLEPVKARALSNIDHPQRGEIAKRNLVIIASIESSMSTAENLKDLKASKTYDFTIKMWDRKPQHDLFQGNYSTCCIGMGGGNGSAQPHYLLNTSCNMIEIIDNVSGKTIGNALCYFGKNAEGKPIFIIDNLEINNSIKFTEEAGKDFRSAVTQYASNISRAVTGHENTEIFIGASYNDIPTNDLQVCNNKISFIGQLDCEELYLDVYSGWVNTNELTGQRKLLRLK